MAVRKVIVTIAPTGGMASKKQNPNIPTQPQEIADDVHRCYNAGASVVAVHARRPDDEATCDPAVYRRINELIRAKCNIIINNSTGGGINGDMVRQAPNGYFEIIWDERLKGMEAGAEMCTLDPTTIVANFGGKEILMNTSPSRCRYLAETMKAKGIKPEWEVFSPTHLLQDVVSCLDAGLDTGAIFNVSAIGPAQLNAALQSLLLGGHVRVGLEDNLYYSRGRLANNVELVERIVRIIRDLDMEPATPAEARELMGLKQRVAA